MNKKTRNHGLRLIAFMLTFIMIIGLVPVSAAAKKVTYGYSSVYDAEITLTDSKGNEIKPGDSVVVGTKLTLKVVAAEFYEMGEGSSVELTMYQDDPYYYDWQYLYLDKNSTVTFTAPEYDFYFWVSASSVYDLTVKGDKHVKSITVSSTDGKTSKTFSGNKANLQVSPSSGFNYGEINVAYEFESGYILSSEDTEVAYFEGYNSDGSSKFELYKSDYYDYDKEEYVYTNKNVITVSTKKGKNSTDYSAYDKLTTAKATLNKSKGTLTLKAKKTIVTLGYYSYEYDWGYEEWLSSYDAKFNAKNAKNVERIDLSKITKVDSYTVSTLLNYIIREYKKGNMPNLKAICLPKGYTVVVSEYDGYMPYYPLVIYNAQ